MEPKKRTPDKQAARQRKEDIILNYVLIWFGGAVAAELLLLLVNRFYIHYTVEGINFAYYLSTILPALAIAGLAGGIFCVIWWMIGHKKGKNCHAARIFTPITFGISIIFAVSYQFQGTGVQLLCIAVPVVTVLAIIYLLYQRDFFACTALSAMGLLGLWIVRRADGGHRVLVYSYLAVAAIVLLAAVIAARLLQKNMGAWGKGEQLIPILHHNANYAIIYLTCAIVAAALALAAVLGLTVAYYLILALVVWLFIMAVYYTVRLM